jgi:hypothetical protein
MTIAEMDWEIGATASQSGARRTVIMGIPGASKAIVQLDQTDTFNGTAFDAVLERTGLAISGQDRRKELTVDPSTVKYMREFYPRVSGATGTELMFRFGYQMLFEEAITWKPWMTFTVGETRKLDTDISFCYLGMQIKATDAFVEFDGYDMDLEVVGRY